jgi:MFS family permease
VSSYLRVLRYPDFRYLFLGQSASAVGDRVVVVALALFVVQSSGSPGDLGLVLACQSLPLVALLLLGGVWADRLPRQRIMIGTDLLRAALHTVLAALILAGSARIWQLCALEAMFGAAQAFFQPAYSGLLPQTVPEELVQDARALTESAANLAFLLGPALATALVLGVGAGEAFAFDAATFIVSALLLARVRPRARGAVQRQASMAHELRVGWREVRSRPWVWVTIAAFSGTLLCVFAQWYALAPALARSLYGSAGIFGVLEAIAGAGAVAGALIALRWRPRHQLWTGLSLILVWPVESAVFAFHAPLAVVACLSFAAGIAFSMFLVWWETALVQHIPASALSRVSAYDWMGSLALLPLGYALSGTFAGALGARTTLEVGAAIGVLLMALALTPRSTRELTTPKRPPAGPPQAGPALAEDDPAAPAQDGAGVLADSPGAMGSALYPGR